MQQQERLHALDALRAFALLLGVFLHAAMSFIDVEVENLNWAIADNSQSDSLLLLVGVIHVFRMSLFFFIAGFFAHLVYHRKGAGEFASNRAVRIAVPLVVGWCVVSPLLTLIWQWGSAKSGVSIARDLWPSQEEWMSGEIRLSHLWFLYYLLRCYVLIVGLRHLLADRLDKSGQVRQRIDAVMQTLLDRRWIAVVLSLPLAITAMFSPQWIASQGMPTPDRSLIPEMIPLVGYGTTFAAGWVFHRVPDLLRLVAERVKSSFWLALLSVIATTATTTTLVMQPTWMPTLMRFLTGLTATSMMWFFNFALIGIALKRFANPSPATRYVADASYWMYIAHLPIVCVLQIWVAHWPLHWTIKYPLIVAVAFAALIASYHYLVRYTFIGAVLNGRKYRQEEASKLANGIGVHR